MKTKTLSKRLWGILCLILLCPLSLMAETDYTHYTLVPGNNIDLNPGYDEVSLTAMVSHNRTGHKMYACIFR